MRIVVLASGRGSNLCAMLDAEQRGGLHAYVAAVFCDKPDAPALDHARAAGITAYAIDARQFACRDQFDRALFAKIATCAPDLIVLAGFMRIIGADTLAPWTGRMINIHPSLLPKYPGLHTHRRALEAGDARHGASVHFVTAELDGGPVIAQTTIDIHDGDSATSLAARLLPREHALLVASIGLFARKRLCWRSDGPELDGKPLLAPLILPDGEANFPAVR